MFSKRRAQIEAQLDELGYDSPRAAEIAALDTRRAKTHGGASMPLSELWRTEALAAGLDLEVLERLIGPPRPVIELTVGEVEEVQRFLEGPDGLTGRASTFDRRGVVMAWSDYLPEGARVEQVEAYVDAFLARPGGGVSCRVRSAGPGDPGHGRQRQGRPVLHP